MLGNGDCTVITTPSNKTIIIDTGEQENVLTKYLLDRKIINIDYLIISHFDSDHCKNAIDLIERLNIKNIIVSKQAKESQEFENTINAAKSKKVKIKIVKAGDIIKIDNQLKIRILWPSDNLIHENPLNNNSIVAKLEYKNFSMLFTGDIEAIAEKQIISNYSDNILKSTILKVAHHGSKTSSTEELIKKILPTISLIGVGENNKFGHPSNQTIKTLESYKSRIYRTDLSGEITVKINRTGKIKINTKL